MINKQKSLAGWKWYGFPGHHICSNRCVFHLATNIKDLFLVSTIGHFIPDPLKQPNKIENVAVDGAQYETMVFSIVGEDDFGNPKRLSYSEIKTQRYVDSISAEKGHYDICTEYADKAESYLQLGIEENKLQKLWDILNSLNNSVPEYDEQLDKIRCRDFTKEEFLLWTTDFADILSPQKDVNPSAISFVKVSLGQGKTF